MNNLYKLGINIVPSVKNSIAGRMNEMKITGLKGKIKGNGTYIALAICMIGIGACGWFTIGKNAAGNASADTSSVGITADVSSYNKTLKAGAVVSPAGTSSSGPSSSVSSGNPSSAADSASDSSSTAAVQADYLVLPVTGEILKPFSLKELQYSETFADWRLHNAIDIAADKGAVIRSAGDGTVADVYTDTQYGKVVKIDHGNGIITVYSGLDTVYVKKGETIGINEDIGTLGEIPCESCDKSHLHFAVIKSGAYISPLEAVKME